MIFIPYIISYFFKICIIDKGNTVVIPLTPVRRNYKLISPVIVNYTSHHDINIKKNQQNYVILPKV